MMHRRQKRQTVFAGFLALVALVNILFFLILLRPARSDYFNLQSSIDKLKVQVGSSQATVTKLEKTSDQLERFDQDRESLFTSHFIKFDPGFAELSPHLNDLALQAGVARPVVDFTRDEVKQYGLYSVKIKIPVTGGYTNAVNFIKSLETSDTFFLINSIDVRSSAEGGPAPAQPVLATASGIPAVRTTAATTNNANAAPTSGASVALNLSLETFFYK